MRRLPWRSSRSYWQAYRQQFDDNGTSLSVREFFRKAMLRALGKAGDDDAETTEKVKRIS
jgi:type VI secretion system protein ImpI